MSNTLRIHSEIPLVYFDVCVWFRLTDDRVSNRIRDEAEAVETILALATSIRLVSSPAVEVESSRNPVASERIIVDSLLRGIDVRLDFNADVERHRDHWLTRGLSAFDALHVAFAEAYRVDYFCTVDDKLRKKVATILPPPPSVIGPVELIREIGI